MGKPRKQHRKNKFNYDQNRRKLWKKSKKLPHIECDPIRKAWDAKKSVQANLTEMGISADPNKTIKNLVAKDESTSTLFPLKTKSQISTTKQTKKNVVQELETEASAPTERTLHLSEPEVRYCTYMMEKYGEDYKAMARDSRNHYQDTPKQIKRKILLFKSIPDQYNAYLSSRGMSVFSSVTHESTDVMAPVTPPCRPHPLKPPVIARKATRAYRAKRRNGHYLTPSIGDTPVTRHTKSRIGVSEVPYHKIRRRLQFGRKPPTSRHSEGLQEKFEALGIKVELKTETLPDNIPNKEIQQGTESRNGNTVTRGRKYRISKEMIKLIDMSDSTVLPTRLRSSKHNKNRYVDHNLEQGTVSPERNKGRQN